ncbi:MAG: hypothetical protein A2521_08805 [Deltaproteobacteria bacterium RIFOXYD12_FULL_57_12]|nr:MAG: hypothetical protein A2521_08805 [Deltaproteobacteria bacterium RIFOXYD12_FULL_57_12]
MGRCTSILAFACFSLLLIASTAKEVQGGPPSLPAGFMEKHIEQMKKERPGQYQRLLAAARQPITDCGSCHVQARRPSK